MSGNKFVGQLKGLRYPISFEWEIPNFLSLSANVDDEHQSSMFFFCDSTWYLTLYPNGQEEDSSEGYVGLYLMRGDWGPPVSVTYSLFLKKADDKEAALTNWNYTFEEKDIGMGHSRIIRRSELIEKRSQFLPSGALTVIIYLKCNETEARVTEKKDFALQTIACRELSAAAPNVKVLSDLEKVFLSKDDCDVTLHVKEQKFEAHRMILKARSPVFASMLSHDMKEKNTGLIHIKDCEPEHFVDFLRFLYCGSVDSITPQNMCSLYRAADKYNVQDLKSECLASMKSHLDVENFCDVLTLAVQHSEAELMKLATDLFNENALNILKTVKWQLFLHENTTLGNELIIKAFSARK